MNYKTYCKLILESDKEDLIYFNDLIASFEKDNPTVEILNNLEKPILSKESRKENYLIKSGFNNIRKIYYLHIYSKEQDNVDFEEGLNGFIRLINSVVHNLNKNKKDVYKVISCYSETFDSTTPHFYINAQILNYLADNGIELCMTTNYMGCSIDCEE